MWAISMFQFIIILFDLVGHFEISDQQKLETLPIVKFI